MAERPALGFWVFWVVDIFTSSLGERAMMLVEMLFVGRRGDEFARFSHEAGEIPSEPWQLTTVTCAVRV